MTKEPIQKQGKVFVQTSKGVFPYSVLKQAELNNSANASAQLKDDEKWLSDGGLISRPYPPESFLLLYESNAYFWRCVNQLATDVAGLEWTLSLKEGKKENQQEQERLKQLLRHLNSEDNLRTLIKKLIIDWGSVGWFGLEIANNLKGLPSQVFHVPAHTLWVHKSNEKYCQKRKGKKVWFKKPEGKDINVKTGELGATTAATRANSLVFYKNYYPKSDYYGVPNALAATGDVIGLIGIRDYNLAFFENYGMPSALIILDGEWEDGSDKKVEAFLDSQVKGSDNAHKTLVVTQPTGCKFTYTPLSTEVKEGAFRLYESDRREAILAAYAMPPERVGMRIVGKLGGNVAEEATRIYIQSTVEPLQMDIEELFNKYVLKSELYELKFESIDLRDYNAEVTRMNTMIEHAILTPNEARNELGYKPYEGGDKFYMGSALLEVGAPDLDEALYTGPETGEEPPPQVEPNEGE